VYRWPYNAGDRKNLGSHQVVVNKIPASGHVTRTIVFDSQGRMYVQVGSEANVAPNSNQARIHRWSASAVEKGNLDWLTGELFADGLRNEVGLRFDRQERLWGVENGMDNLARPDLGGDIHNDNPAEELNFFNTSTPGLFYGYPYCWTQYKLNTPTPVGTNWATPDFMPEIKDAWCNNNNNVVKPKLSMQAHYAPLDIEFYYGMTFPKAYQGSAFVACHGSWNRRPPVGYRVLHVTFNGDGMPVSYSPFLSYVGPGDTGPDWQRPVALAVGNCASFKECLFVTSDATGLIIAIGYKP